MKRLTMYSFLRIVTPKREPVVIPEDLKKQTMTSDAESEPAFNETMRKEEEEADGIAYLSYGRDLLLEFLNSTSPVKFAFETIQTTNDKLDEVQTSLLKALEVLPATSESQAELTQLLMKLAQIRVVIGNALLNETMSIQSYQKALEIYTHRYFARKNPLEALRVYSQIISLYFKQELYSKVIPLARKALKLYTHCLDEEGSHAVVFKIYSDLMSACIKTKNYSKAMAFARSDLELYRKDSKTTLMYEKVKSYLIQVISAQAFDMIANPPPVKTLQTTALQKVGTFATEAAEQETQTQSGAYLNSTQKVQLLLTLT